MNQRPTKTRTMRQPCRQLGGMIGIAAISLTLTAGVARADTLISYWNFNDEPSGAIDGPLQANVGSGQIDVSGWGGSSSIGSGFVGGGTDENSLFGDPAGNSFRLAGTDGNFTHIDFQFTMADRQDLSMSYALRPQWSSASGDHTYNFHIWSWSTNGVDFTETIGYEIAEFGGVSDWWTYDLDFSPVSALNGAEDVTLRLSLGGANSSQFTSFDNIQVQGSFIPAPAALSLFGFAGLSFCRTRRRSR